MATLANNDELAISQGAYMFDVTGALELQWRPVSTFVTMKDATFAGAESGGLITLPATTLKVINAGVNTFTLLKAR